MRSRKPADRGTPEFTTHEGPPPEFGRALFEREIPSDSALVAPLVVRTMEFLCKESIVSADEQNEIGLCLLEALQNAVCHGNKSNFQKKVHLSIFAGESGTVFVVSDEGDGFDLSQIKSPVSAETIWDESGRGIYLISHYMDRAAFYRGGRTLVMTRDP